MGRKPNAGAEHTHNQRIAGFDKLDAAADAHAQELVAASRPSCFAIEAHIPALLVGLNAVSRRDSVEVALAGISGDFVPWCQ